MEFSPIIGHRTVSRNRVHLIYVFVKRIEQMFNLRDLFLINIRSVIDTLNKTDVLSVMLKATNVFAEGANIGDIGSKLKMVAKLMRLNEQRKVNRDVFLVKQVSCYAHH